MLYLVGGFAILGGFLLLLRLFVNADPARLARNLKWTAIAVGAIAVVGLILLPPVREFAALLLPLAMSMPLLSRLRRVFDRYRNPGGPRTSQAQTDFVRMTLDLETGSMSGTVLRGRFAGMRIEELAIADLLALLRECRAEDEKAARLVEAYLDRLHPDWRDAMAGGPAGGDGGAPPADGGMTVDEACAILGVARGASAQEIKE